MLCTKRIHQFQYCAHNILKENHFKNLLRLFWLWTKRKKLNSKTKATEFHLIYPMHAVWVDFLWFFSFIFNFTEWFQHWSWSERSSCQSIVWWCCWTNQCNVNGFNQHETCVGGKHIKNTTFFLIPFWKN